MAVARGGRARTVSFHTVLDSGSAPANSFDDVLDEPITVRQGEMALKSPAPRHVRAEHLALIDLHSASPLRYAARVDSDSGLAESTVDNEINLEIRGGGHDTSSSIALHARVPSASGGSCVRDGHG